VNRADRPVEPATFSALDFAGALSEENRLFGDLVFSADPAAPVPTCPEWTITQLFRHVGRGDRWAATIVRERVDSRVDPKTVPGGKPPEDRDAALRWLHESPRTLVDAVAKVGPDAPCWTFIGPRPAAWWIRRRLHETVVHRADAAIAVGAEYPLDPVLAADALSEWLDIVVGTAGRRGAMPLEAGTSMHLHATDDGLGADGEWLIELTDGAVTWSHGHAKASVAVRGRAVDLLLATVRRLPAQMSGGAEGPQGETPHVLGDAEVWTRWLERTPF
jgi:uncharacterized protein (TIGR03083 family)